MFSLSTPLPVGAVLRFPATWDEYLSLSEGRGDGSLPRIKFRNGEILLMNPLPEHGKGADIISSLVKVLLEQLDQDYDAFTPITMKLPEASGIEPDYCFYIDSWEAVRGKKRIDWQNDPPPDLVIEMDVTSFTAAEDYLPYRVPELWLLKGEQLNLYRLTDSAYQLSAESRYFVGVDLQKLVSECLRIAYAENTSAAMRWLRQNL